MNINMVLGALFGVVGVVLLFVGGWFGVLIGVLAILMGLVLLARGYRARSARA